MIPGNIARVTRHMLESQGTSYDIYIPLHNLSILHDTMFKLDFEALYIYFSQKDYLNKYIPGSQTALVSCKNVV